MDNIPRRNFVKTAATTAAMAALAPSQALGQQAPSENIHFALIGAGGQGRWDSTCLLGVPGVKLTAICDINPYHVAEAKKLAPEARVYDDWNELYSKEKDLQAALVALPENTHAPAAIAAMQSGLDVFCEKPMAYSTDEARQMIDTRDKTQRVLQIGQQRRSNPLYYLAEQLVQKEGILGEILRIETFWDRWADWKVGVPPFDKDFKKWGYPSPDHLVNWRLYRKYGHGLITENGTHQLDAASWMLGGKKAHRVTGLGAIRYDDHRETHDICTAEYLFEGDTIVRFAQDFHQGLNYGWSYGELLLGSEAAMRITAEQEIVLYDRKRKATKIPIERLGDYELGGLVSPSTVLQQAEADRANSGLRTYSYQHQMRIFVDCIKNRKQPTCTGEIGHNSIAFTVTGANAQYDNKVCEFAPDDFVG